MNPYASNLDGRNALDIIAATPDRLQALAAALGPERLETPPAPGKWTPAQVLAHLADAEVAFAFRLRQTLAEPGHVIQPWDQDKWAAAPVRYSAHDALATFSSLRRWNVLLIQSLSPGDLASPVTHPERGAMTLGTIVETMGGHDINHIRQLENLQSQAA